MTKAKKFIAAAAAALALASSPAFALTAPEALQTMQAHGFYGVKDFDREHGYWTAKAISKEGVRHYLLLNDATGEFLAFTRADIGTRLPGISQVIEKLRQLGFAVINDVEFDDGLWEAKVRQHERGAKVKLHLHPVTLEVISQVSRGGNAAQPGNPNPTPILTAQQVVAALQAAGYRNVHDLEFEHGRWEADAVNAAGQRVELHINPYTGAIERERLDD